MSMSISIHSNSAGNAARNTEAAAPARRRDDPESSHRTEPGRSVGRSGHHALVDALKQALGSLTPASEPSSTAPALPAARVSSSHELKDALHEFAHALFGALRPAAGDDAGPGRRGQGFAWGRTDPADLAQRLDAVIQRLQAGQVPAETEGSSAIAPAAPTPADDPTAVGADTDISVIAAASAMPVVNADVAPAASDTTISAVVATPAGSKLTAAFERLSQALAPSDTSSSAGSVSTTDRLVELLQRLASALRGDNAGDLPPTGSLLDVTA
ncbi:MAG: hypothetical protein ABIQ60_10725 [Burkholderiaceae bacterium]